MGHRSPSQKIRADMRPPARAGEGQWSGAGLLEQALTRAAGAQLVGGNKVRILHDAAEHYPAWLGAICTAERTIFFESSWIVAVLGFMLLVAAAAAVQWPLVAALPVAALAAWIGIAFLGRAADLRRERRRCLRSNK